MQPLSSTVRGVDESSHAGLWTRDMPARAPVHLSPKALNDHRRNNIDAIRFCLASFVILSHVFPLLDGVGTTEPLNRLTLQQVSFGSLAVSCFFVLSGYLITASWMRSAGVASYLKKRILRIHPGFAVAMAISFFIVAPLAGTNLHQLFALRHVVGAGLLNLLMLHAYMEHTAFLHNPDPVVINGSLWTIHFEFCYYLLIPLIALVRPAARLHVTVGLLIASCFAAGYISHQEFPIHFNKWIAWMVGTQDEWARTLPYFLAGMAYYFGKDRVKLTGTGTALATIAIVVAARVPHSICMVAPIAGAYLLFWLAFNRRVPLQGFGRYGDFSYGIYLYSCPIQQLLIQRLAVGHLALFMISWPLSIIAGVLSWFCVERHFIQMKRKQPAAVISHDLTRQPIGSVAGELIRNIAPELYSQPVLA